MNEIFITKNIFSKSISKKEQWDINVPDSCPDILKILYSDVNCFVGEYSFSDSEFSAKIEASADVLYIPEGDETREIQSLHTKEEFFVKCDIPKGEKFDFESVDLKKDACGCVMLNSRKVGIKLDVTVYTQLFSDVLIPDFSEEKDIVFDQKELEASYICAQKNEHIPFSEQFTMPPAKSGIDRILCYDVSFQNPEMKAITNKGVLKGDINLKILYLSENDTVECVEFSAPFTEIIDINGINDDVSVIFEAEIAKSEVKKENNGKIVFDGIINVDVKGFLTEKIYYAQDGYCPEFEETVAKESLRCSLISPCFFDTHNMKEVLCFDDFEISEVYFVRPVSTISSCEIQGNKVLIGASLMCDVIYKTQNGIRCDRKTVDFEFVQDIKNNCGYDKAQVSNEIKNFSFVIQGHNCIEVRCNVDFTTYLFAENEISFINDVQVDKTKRKALNRASVVAYYPKKDERVFDICKKYNSTPKKLQFINSLGDCDVCKKGTCIIIE